MNQELDEALVRDFPNLFADRSGDIRQTCMVWGFECGSGWEPLIRELAEKLEPLCKAYTEQMTEDQMEWYGGGPRASQIKEKYGTLRFYMTSETDEMSKHIREAEEKSEITCETCGKPGTLRGKYWLYVSCAEHAKDEDKTVIEVANEVMKTHKNTFERLAKAEEEEKKK